MADAKQCDRCKKLYLVAEKQEKEFSANYNVLTIHRDKSQCDLCEDCSRELVKFFNGYPYSEVKNKNK